MPQQATIQELENEKPHISEQEKKLILLTGIFIGEGCVGIYKDPRRDRSFSGGLKLTNTEYPIINAFKDQFGGSCYIEKSRKIYHWQVYGITAINTIKKIIPYIEFSKKEQMKLVLKLQDIKDKHKIGHTYSDQGLQEMEFLCTEIKRLKREFNATSTSTGLKLK